MSRLGDLIPDAARALGLEDELRLARAIATFEALPQLGPQHAYTLARNSFEASFAPAADKARWVQALDETFARAA